MMINPSDASTLTFQTDSPLSKLVEHCNKFGDVATKKMVVDTNGGGVGVGGGGSGGGALGVKEVSPTDSLLLPNDMASYASYQHFLPTTNWWVDQANWQLAYPAAAAAAASDAYHNYLTPLLTSSTTNITTNTATITPSSGRANKKLASSTQPSSSSPNHGGVTSGATPTSTAAPTNGGGKYQSRSNCECPNCQETERVGVNNVAARKRGVHNCHIAGCGKVYNKSSHLKAHLRWHSGERPSKKRPGDAPI